MTKYDVLCTKLVIMIHVRPKLYLILILGNVSSYLGQLMTKYDFLELDEWVWAMFEPTSASLDFTIG